MANALLVGVNPLFGLYAAMIGPLVGGLLVSTRLMVVTTTAAASLTAGQALGDLEGATREAALVLLVVFVGVFQVLFGVLGLGKLTRFVSYSVMTGFLLGVGVLIILSQMPNVTGYAAEGANATLRFFDLLTHLGRIDPWSLSVALLTLLLAITLPLTRLGNFGILAAIAVPSILVAVSGVEGIRTVSDVGEIARGFPMPRLPSFAHMLDVLVGALAVAVVIVVQSSGISQSVPNPDGRRSSISRDFAAIGIANVSSGLFRGLPVGGSLSATALSLLGGASSRWTAVTAGLYMALIVIGFPQVVSPIVMPALGALLILAGVRTLRPPQLLSIWRAGWMSRVAMVTTFLSMLFLPIEAAVGIGVALSAILYLGRASNDVTVVELIERPDGRIEERTPPKQLPSNAVTVLHVYGHLFFAGARTLEARLPSPRGAENLAVVLRLRGRSHIGATLVDVLASYVQTLQAANGRLYLSGLSPQVHEDIIRTAKLDLSGPVRAYDVTPLFMQSTQEAVADACAWLVSLREGEQP